MICELTLVVIFNVVESQETITFFSEFFSVSCLRERHFGISLIFPVRSLKIVFHPYGSVVEFTAIIFFCKY